MGRSMNTFAISLARPASNNDCIYLVGSRTKNSVQRYASASVCVQPSQYEGFGLQPLEALACGAPLVISPEPSVQEVVGDAAVIARDSSELSLADCIAKLWCDKAQMSSLRKQGPMRAAQFSWERTSTLLADLLVSLAQSKAVSPSLTTQS